MSGIGNIRPKLPFNLYRHKSPVLTLYFLVPSSTNLYWPSATKYHPASPFTEPVASSTNRYHFIIHHLVTHSWANRIFSLITTHLMSRAPYTWSSFLWNLIKTISNIYEGIDSGLGENGQDWYVLIREPFKYYLVDFTARALPWGWYSVLAHKVVLAAPST